MTEQRELNPIACFLTACEIERRASRTSRREQSVVSGRRISADGGRFVYLFQSAANSSEPLSANQALKEDNQIQILANNATYHGTVISLSNNCAKVALNTDLGESVERAKLDGGAIDLLQALILRLRALGSDDQVELGFNSSLANSLLDITDLPTNYPEPAKVLPEFEDLTSDQYSAFERSAKQSLTFVWGPPGTGKTALLAALAQRFFQENKRVLIVSHTNHAVDGVIEALCRRLTERRKIAVPEGGVLRVGAPVKESLIGAFGDQVGLEAVVAKSHQKVSQRLKQLHRELSEVRDELFSVSRKLVMLDSYQQLKSDLNRLSGGVQSERSDPELRAVLERVFESQGEAVKELGDIEFVEQALQKIESEVAGGDRRALVERSVELSERQIELTEAIAVLDKFVRDLRISLLERARVVGTTTTTAILSCKELKEFDVVLVDEASMVPLPVCYLLAGMARERCIIAGDFRQLPTITRSDAPMVRQWYSRDVFEVSGAIRALEQPGGHPAAVALTTQFRSHQSLCDLINNRFYGGKLVTHDSAQKPYHIFREPLTYLNHARIVSIDTSSIAPWGANSERSKSNLAHALLVRKMALLMCAHGAALLPESLGVITPYRAQANLIKDLLIECSLGESVTVGTVHKYQGGERDTIILDLTESEPHSLGSFLSATSFADTGARLLNVALSRAKRHLIVLGNIEFLRQRLPSGAILSGVLDDILKVSHKLSVQELVNQPVFNTPSLEVRSSAEVLAFQSFGIEEFTPALVSELLEARSEVILISPTVSRQCADVFGVVLQGRVKAGVKVSVHTQLGQQADYEQQSAVLALKRAGIVIKPYTAGQPLCVVIDSEVVWLGSIPPLDSIGKATGEMTRSVSARAALFVLSCCEELANEQHEAVAVARFSY